MDDSARRAAERRLAQWEHGVASHEDLDDLAFERWGELPASVRFQACFDVSREAWSIVPRDESGPLLAFGNSMQNEFVSRRVA
jgi:hypothetical protein